MNRLQLFFSFRGRIGRRRFAGGVSAVALCLLLATALSCFTRLAKADTPEAAVAALLASLQEERDPMLAAAAVCLWAALALAAKRLHDIDKSVWSLVGVNLFFAIAASAVFSGAFEYDELLNYSSYAALLCAFVYWLWMAFLTLICEGDCFANGYGLQPGVTARNEAPTEGRAPRQRGTLTSIVQKRGA